MKSYPLQGNSCVFSHFLSGHSFFSYGAPAADYFLKADKTKLLP